MLVVLLLSSPHEQIRDAGSVPLDLGPISPPRYSKNKEQNQDIPEGHLEHLPLVDMLAPVVVAVQHLPKKGLIELGIRLQALGALADVRQHQARLPIRGQLVLLHTPVGHHGPREMSQAQSNPPREPLPSPAKHHQHLQQSFGHMKGHRAQSLCPGWVG